MPAACAVGWSLGPTACMHPFFCRFCSPGSALADACVFLAFAYGKGQEFRKMREKLSSCSADELAKHKWVKDLRDAIFEIHFQGKIKIQKQCPATYEHLNTLVGWVTKPPDCAITLQILVHVPYPETPRMEMNLSYCQQPPSSIKNCSLTGFPYSIP